MKITVERVSDTYHFEGVNDEGNKVDIDASPAIGGTGKGVRPMQLLIMGLGGCSGIDVISILNKMRQEVKGFKVELEAEREPDKEPSLFQKVHAHFILEGDIDKSKAEKAVSLSIEKYCSVAKTLEKTAEITWSVEVKS